MRNIDMEKELLLRGSGELPRQRMKALESALVDSPELRTMEQEMKGLQTLWREVTAETSSPSGAVLERIHREATARTRQFRAPAVIVPFRISRFTLAYASAAAIVIMTAGLLIHTALRPGAEDDGNNSLDARIAEVLDDIDVSLIAVLDNLADSGNPAEVERDALAMRLMLMEDS